MQTSQPVAPSPIEHRQTGPAGPVTPGLSLASAATQSVAEVFTQLGSSEAGLSSAEAAQRLRTYGSNSLPLKRVTTWGVLWRQLRNPLLILLIGAAVISVATGDTADGIIIAAIVILSVGLGFFNEYRSEQAVVALQSNVRTFALVLRDGQQQQIDVHDVVPGDVVTLQVGALVPADVRLVQVNQLECNEAVLTGESTAAVKTAEPVEPTDSALDLSSCAFLGTIIRQGSGTGVVVATATKTEFGKIAAALTTHDAETAFQVGLRGFSRLLVTVGAILTTAVFISNLILHRPLLQALLFSLAIAIGITPQLLPAIVSVSLAGGSRQLAKRNVLVKRLVTVEDLGNVEVLFTDKTGTLTDGAITFNNALDVVGKDSVEPIRLGLICNEATATSSGAVGGNALDIAIWAAPGATELFSEAAKTVAVRRLVMLPFDHDRQMTSVLVQSATNDSTLITKGAPEAVFARCSNITAATTQSLEAQFSAGARVIAVATKQMHQAINATAADEGDLTLVGLLCFVDRPKQGVAAAVAKLVGLGVTIKVITGDNGTVAAKVCRDIGLLVDGVITGAELAALSDDEAAERIAATTVFSRISPEQKARIVAIARRTGIDVAFLGDGVNDAVALHAADIGISVESATDVAKDAADIVLLDKDLGVLAEGILEGRRIFANTLKYVLMSTSSNFGNMFSAAGASAFLSFLPMLPTQILLNNLLYDVGQLAIPTDRVDDEVLAKPSAWNIAMVKRYMLVFGSVSSLFDIATFVVLLQVLHASQEEFRTGWFVESVVTQTLIIFVIRTRRVPFFRSRPSIALMAIPSTFAAIGIALPFTGLAHYLGFTPLPGRFFAIQFVMIIAYVVLVDGVKQWFFKTQFVMPQHVTVTRIDAAQRNRRHVVRRARHFAHRPAHGSRSRHH
jgi:P-type Mg2+ transporter